MYPTLPSVVAGNTASLARTGAPVALLLALATLLLVAGFLLLRAGRTTSSV